MIGNDNVLQVFRAIRLKVRLKVRGKSYGLKNLQHVIIAYHYVGKSYSVCVLWILV